MITPVLELPTVKETGLVKQALAIKITNNEIFEESAQILKALADERKEIIKQTEGVVKQAYDLHKKLKADQNTLVKPIEEAERYLRSELGRYEQEQAKIRLEEERKAAEQRRKAEEEARILAASEAEKIGNITVANAILDESFTPPEVNIAKSEIITQTITAPKPQGIAFTTVYDVLVTDKLTFIRWVASKPEFIHFLNTDETAIKQFAKSTQGTVQPAGIKISARQVARTTGR